MTSPLNNRIRTDAATSTVPMDQDVPTMGILTRTMIPTSVIKKIIPARLRHKDKNDVIFVTDDFIEIKEYQDNGSLEHIARSSHFGSKILSACCLGTPATHIKPERVSARGISAAIKIDPDAMNTGIESGKLMPPHVLALMMESGALAFLFAYYDSTRRLQFKASKARPIFAGGEYVQKPGYHMAKDSTSSLLAVAPHEGHISLFPVEQMSELQASLDLSSSLQDFDFDPVAGEKTITIRGSILMMDFLIPSQGLDDTKDSTVVLIVIASYHSRTRLHRYEWDCNTDIGEFKEVGSGHLLSSEEQTPLLLIPITISSGFLLVCETRAFLYGNTSQGCWEPPWPQNLNDEEIDGVIIDSEEADSSEQERGGSYRAPVWTQWTRPIRRPDWFTGYDAIYVCREDGVVKYLLIGAQDRRPTISRCKVGNINANVDSAVACIDNGTSGTWHEDGNDSEDVLVAGGSMGDGALYHFKGRHNAVRGQIIPRWTPLLDVCSVPAVPSDIPATPFTIPNEPPFKGPEQLFACIGRGPRHGAVCEIQYGTQASVSTTFVLPDPTFLDLWALCKPLSKDQTAETMILVTDPQETQMINGRGEVMLMEDHGLDGTTQTIAAGSSPDGLVIQITHQAIRVAPLWSKSLPVYEVKKDVVAAFVNGSIPLVLTCIRQGNEYSLHLIEFVIEGNKIVPKPIGDPVPLKTEATSLCLYASEDKFIAFAGDLDHQLQIFRGTQKDGLRLVDEIAFGGFQKDVSDTESGICDSIALISSPRGDDFGVAFWVLCGLRDGKIETYEITLRGTGFLVTYQETYIMGETSVKVAPDITSIVRVTGLCTRALVCCGGQLCRVCYEPSKQAAAGTFISRIWLVDHKELGRQMSSITALAQPELWTVYPMRGYNRQTLFSIENANVHVADIEPSTVPQALPRPLPIGGTPSRMIYSRHLQKLIVGFTKTVVKDSPTQKSRLHFPMITLVDPYQDFSKVLTEADNDLGDSPKSTTQNIGKSGERILGLLEWFPCSDPEKTYHFIVVNTTRKRKGATPATGRIILYHAQEEEGRVVLQEKTAVKQNEPVYALAAYGKGSFVHCTGSNLVLQELTTSVDGKWKIKQVATFALPSPGIFITVHETSIHVTTKEHSVMVLQVAHNRLIPTLGDEVARISLRHLSWGEHPVTLVADIHGTVAGLWRPPYTPANKSFSTMFEAKLPGSITRLCNACLRPRWYRRAHGDAATIIGTSLNGAVYQFTILTEHEWRLLKFVQNLIESNHLLSPFSHPGPAPGRLEPLEDSHLAKHVDGDVLARLLQDGQLLPHVLLRGMMNEEWEDSDGEEELSDAAKRMERFGALAVNALGMDEGEDEDPFVRVVDYLRFVLQITM